MNKVVYYFAVAASPFLIFGAAYLYIGPPKKAEEPQNCKVIRQLTELKESLDNGTKWADAPETYGTVSASELDADLKLMQEHFPCIERVIE